MLRTLIETLLATACVGAGAGILYLYTPAWGLPGFFAGLILVAVGLALGSLAFRKVHAWLEFMFAIIIAAGGILIIANPAPQWGPLGFVIGIIVTLSGVAFAGQSLGGLGRNDQKRSTTFDHWSTPNRSTRVGTGRDDRDSMDDGGGASE